MATVSLPKRYYNALIRAGVDPNEYVRTVVLKQMVEDGLDELMEEKTKHCTY